jgi:G3E family GTPase
MDKKIAGLLGAVAAVGTLNSAQASPTPASNPSEALRANSYAELLEPIPNAAKILQALDEQAPTKSADEGNVKLAQWYHHHHHHHHHHHWWGYGPRVIVVPPRRRYYHHHHHHHHHHHWYYRY